MDTDQFSDVQILARTLAGECENQGTEGIQAVANVIMRRVALKWQGETTVRGVCLHHEQFSCWNDVPDNNDRKRILAITATNDFAFNACVAAADAAINGTLDDVTYGADSYQVVGTDAYWSKDLTPTITIKKHAFYKTVD